MATVHAAFCWSLIIHIMDLSQKAVSWSLHHPTAERDTQNPLYLAENSLFVLKLGTSPNFLPFTLLSLLHDPEMKRWFKNTKNTSPPNHLILENVEFIPGYNFHSPFLRN